MAWSPISLQTLACLRLCPVSTVPQTDPRPRCTIDVHRNPFPNVVSQELCCITSVGINGGMGVGRIRPQFQDSVQQCWVVQGWCIPSLGTYNNHHCLDIESWLHPKNISDSGNNTLLTWLPIQEKQIRKQSKKHAGYHFLWGSSKANK